MTHEPDSNRKSHASRPALEGLDLQRLMTEAIYPDAESEPLVDPPGLDGFEFLRPLGRGGMGSVFLARQVSLDRLVAVKMIHGADPVATQFLDRLEREAQTMARVSHPNLVQVFDFVRLGDGNAAIIMEWIAGGTLRESKLAKDGTRLTVAETLSLVEPVLSGLESAHRSGIVHRDIKPENILISPEGVVKVTDFGLSLPATESERLTVTGTYVGTPGYMAPEQQEGSGEARIDSRTDIYAIGVLLYEMLTGKTPVGNFDSPVTLAPATPRWIDEAVMQCLRTNPADRPASIAELRKLLSGPPSGPSRRKMVAITGAGVAGLAALAGAGFVLTRNRDDRVNSPGESMSPISGIAIEPSNELHILRGGWARHENGWESNGDISLLALDPERSLVNSKLRFGMNRMSGQYSFGVFFRLPQGMGACSLGAWEGDLAGVQAVDGKDLRELPDAFSLPVENGRRYEMEIQFLPDRIITSVDGVERQTQSIAGSELSIVDPWEWDQVDSEGVDLVLVSYQSPTLFDSLSITSV